MEYLCFSDEAVWASLRQSHLAEFVSGLALGLQVWTCSCSCSL